MRTRGDIEEKRLKLAMQKNVWEVTEALDAISLRKEQIPHYLFDIADYLLKEKGFEGTATELLAAIGDETKKKSGCSTVGFLA